MQKLARAGLASALFASSLAATALPVQWQLTGTLTEVMQPPNGDFEPQVHVGATLKLLLSFDDAAPLASIWNPNPRTDPGGGAFYRYQANSVAITAWVDTLGPIPINFVSGAQGGGSILVRDNYPDPDHPATLVDGISISLRNATDPNGEYTNFGLILRGPDLNTFNGPLQGIPQAFNTPVAGLSTAAFQLCRFSPAMEGLDCDLGFVSAQIKSISVVPEPGSQALMLVGVLALLGRLRLRQRKT